jgi:uncharacterized protein YbjT (DUF2867 family)
MPHHVFIAGATGYMGRALAASGLNSTILRPWYVLGPGHLWPYTLLPLYWLLEHVPATREGARRLGLVKLSEMVRALVAAVESPQAGVRVLEVPQIRDPRLVLAVGGPAAS